MRIRRFIRIIIMLTAAALMLMTVTSCGVQDSQQPPPPKTQNEAPGTAISQEAQTEQAETPKVSPAEQEKEPSPGTDEEPETPQETANASETPEETADASETPQETADASETPQETETGVTAKPENPSQGQDGTTPDKVAYITIDDGPSRKITPAILDLLKEEGIKATFFVLPHSGVDDIYQRIIDEGHEMGNHSYSHVYANLYKSDDIEAFKEDVMAARNFIYDKFGYLTVAYRFPGGAMGRKDSIIQPRKEYLAEIGYRWFDWNLSTGDADSTGKGKNANALAANVLDNVKGRSHAVILMHDTYDKSATLEALPMIIAGLRERGYVFETISNYPQE